MIARYEVSVVGFQDYRRTVLAASRGKAKSKYLRELREVWDDLPYTEIRAEKMPGELPELVSSLEFLKVAEQRGVPGARCGDRVQVGEAKGVIVGHNYSSNFQVLFDADSAKYAGTEHNVHPGDLKFLTGREANK